MSPPTLQSFRDSLKLFLQFVAGKKQEPSTLTFEQLTVEDTRAFLHRLEPVLKCVGSCSEGFWLRPRRRGPSIPKVG